MRHPFIKKAKKNSYLMDLIDRHRKWKLTRGEESDSDSGGESGPEGGAEDSDTDWNMTVKGPPSYTDSLGYSEPINSVISEARLSNGGEAGSGNGREGREGRSPSKEIRARSPEKQIIPTGLSPAKSELQIVSFLLLRGAQGPPLSVLIESVSSVFTVHQAIRNLGNLWV